MTGTIDHVWLAGLVLLATHFGVASTRVRDRLVRALGEGPYRGLYSLVAAVALVWLIWAYRDAPPAPVLWAPAWGWIVPALVLPVALALLVGGLGAPNPTSVGGERHLDDPRPATGVLRITRNPVLWAIGLWAIAHLVPNGDLASLALFGTLAVLALLGSALIDLKNRRRRAAVFAPFALATSNLPFLAIVQGRQSLAAALREFGWTRLAAVAALYLVLVILHPLVLGVDALPGVR